MKKICRTCKKQKEIIEYYKARNVDGYSNECKACTIIRSSKSDWRKRNPEKAKIIDRRSYKKHREQQIEQQRKDRLKNPIKFKARDILNGAIRYRKKLRLNYCEFCFSIKNIEAHHFDYNKPLDVIWLCKHCHVILHKYLNK